MTALFSCSNFYVQENIFFTIDTFCQSVVITKEVESGKAALEKIQEICGEIESRISRTVETSEISMLNAAIMLSSTRLKFDLSKETAGLLGTAKYMQEQTNGAFNPYLGNIIDLWGINDYDREHKLPERDDFYPALEIAQNSGYEIKQNGENYYIESDTRIKFDLGAIGKGYAIDEVSDYLVEAGIPNALVSFTSSVLAVGKNRSGYLWTIALNDPINPDPENPCGFINASDKVISVSGGYERYITIGGKDYSHIIDPETGYPVDNDLLCVVVIMDSQSALHSKEQRERLKNNGAVSDALSTALYVMGKEKALNFYNATSTTLDFEMILFVKADNEKGYDIIPTNVIFTEHEIPTAENERLLGRPLPG